ncbi:MAG TPA: hypothetical protein VNH11_23575 [Pirellulales bacterium]|nr:hypothetical protein [Pirellulales bacterium]
MRTKSLYSGAAWRPRVLLLGAYIMLAYVQVTTAAGVLEPVERTSEVDESVLTRIRHEAYPAWERAEAATKNLEVKWTEHEDYSYIDEGGQRASRSLEWIETICWDPRNSRRLTEVAGVGTGHKTRRVLNKEYRFLVYQTPEAALWSLGEGRRGGGAREFKTFEPFEAEHEWILQSSFRVIGVPVRDLIDAPVFTLLEARSMRDSTSSNEEAVILRSRYNGPKTEWILGPAEYWALLRPQDAWFIDRGGVDFLSEQNRQSQTVSYQTGLGGLPFPELLTYDTAQVKADVKLHRTYKLAPPNDCNRSDDEFRLEYYGIPEAALDSRSAWSALVLWALGLVTLVLIYLAVRRVSQRRPPDV